MNGTTTSFPLLESQRIRSLQKALDFARWANVQYVIGTKVYESQNMFPDSFGASFPTVPPTPPAGRLNLKSCMVAAALASTAAAAGDSPSMSAGYPSECTNSFSCGLTAVKAVPSETPSGDEDKGYPFEPAEIVWSPDKYAAKQAMQACIDEMYADS